MEKKRMENLQESRVQLPDTLEDLSRFVLFTQERINAMRAEIRAITKLQAAKALEEQKRQELRSVSDLFIDAQVMVGKLTQALEKDVGGRPKNSSGQGEKFSTYSKAAVLEDLGLDKHQVYDFEAMADHPEAVEQAKREAEAQEKPVTRSAVLNIINGNKAVSQPNDIDLEAENLHVKLRSRQQVNGMYTALKQTLDLFAERGPADYAEAFLCSGDSKIEFVDTLDLIISQLQEIKARVSGATTIKEVK